jgi:hypothetical protein
MRRMQRLFNTAQSKKRLSVAKERDEVCYESYEIISLVMPTQHLQFRFFSSQFSVFISF